MQRVLLKQLLTALDLIYHPDIPIPSQSTHFYHRSATSFETIILRYCHFYFFDFWAQLLVGGDPKFFLTYLKLCRFITHGHGPFGEGKSRALIKEPGGKSSL